MARWMRAPSSSSLPPPRCAKGQNKLSAPQTQQCKSAWLITCARGDMVSKASIVVARHSNMVALV
eukprot:2488527-Rhodomonas_salina.4